MKNTFKDIIKPILVLCSICLVVTGLLAYVNMVTSPIIEKAEVEKSQQAMAEVLPEADGFTNVDINELSNIPEEVSEIHKADNGAGYVFIIITKGYGVSIHRRDCPNIVGMLSDPSSQERMIRVTWASTPTELYQTALQVTGVNRIGLLADVATAISDMNIQMSSVSARAENGNSTIIDLVVNLRSAEQLGSVMLRLKRIQGVSDVTRVVR